jgi:hypothetical protein
MATRDDRYSRAAGLPQVGEYKVAGRVACVAWVGSAPGGIVCVASVESRWAYGSDWDEAMTPWRAKLSHHVDEDWADLTDGHYFPRPGRGNPAADN